MPILRQVLALQCGIADTGVYLSAVSQLRVRAFRTVPVVSVCQLPDASMEFSISPNLPPLFAAYAIPPIPMEIVRRKLSQNTIPRMIGE